MLIVGIVLLLAINGALLALVMRFRSERGRQPRRLVVRRPAQFGTAGAFAVLAIAAFVAITAGILIYVLKLTVGLRVDEQEELEGLDVHEHGVPGYVNDDMMMR